jgi:hypothetical protein
LEHIYVIDCQYARRVYSAVKLVPVVILFLLMQQSIKGLNLSEYIIDSKVVAMVIFCRHYIVIWYVLKMKLGKSSY